MNTVKPETLDAPAASAATVSGPVVLGIETSCDETGVGIVRTTARFV